jgi:hypothetical protein
MRGDAIDAKSHHLILGSSRKAHADSAFRIDSPRLVGTSCAVAAYDLPKAALSYTSARNAASGSRSIIRSYARAAGSGATRPCSQFRSVATGTRIASANATCVIPSRRRIVPGNTPAPSGGAASGSCPSATICRRTSAAPVAATRAASSATPRALISARLLSSSPCRARPCRVAPPYALAAQLPPSPSPRLKPTHPPTLAPTTPYSYLRK